MEKIGYNVAGEFLQVFAGVDSQIEVTLRGHLDNLSRINEVNRSIQYVQNKFTRADKELVTSKKKEIDFTNDAEFRKHHARILEHDKENKIFGHSNSFVWKKEDISPLQEILNAEVKLLVAEVNQISMHITQAHEDRMQYTKSAQEALKEAMDVIRSIQNKTGGR